MERRKIPDRRKIHVFVANDRRKGPFDRRGASARSWERAREKEKIKRIRSFKEKAKMEPSFMPWMDKKRMVLLALAALLIVIVVLSMIR
jgi:hypothetical protein